MLTKSKFRPAWWLRNPHLQTLWAAKIQPAPAPVTTAERLVTADDDFVDLVWSHPRANPAANHEKSPLVILFHGLTGSKHSRYIRSLTHELQTLGYESVLMQFRGCSGEPNRIAGSYHSGHTADIKLVTNTMAERFPDRPIYAIGFSLGGNALLKYLSQIKATPVNYAIAVCPPLQLAEGANRINQGFSKLYQWVLIKQMRLALRQKHKRYPQLELHRYPFESVRNFILWDDQITAPLHGYESGCDYYEQASTLKDLATLTTKTHIIFSADDPFFTERCMPSDNSALSSDVTFEVVRGAGHVGFISGRLPGLGRDWLRYRISGLVIDFATRGIKSP